MIGLLRFMLPTVFLLAALAWHFLILRLAPRLHLVNPNFKNQPVLASYGIVAFPYVAAFVGSLAVLGIADRREAALYLAVMGPMWLLGALDDLFGSREVGGFAGHFRKLIFERKVTTGAIKAVGGGLVGIIAGYVVSGGEPVRWIAAALVIPLSANLVNLIDLRPGRALALFFAGLGVTYVMAWGRAQPPWVVASVVLVALAFMISDARGRAMMGDAWSNTLGAALGLTMVVNTGLPFQIAAIVAMAAIQLYSEKHSISALIEGNRLFRAIDRRLGVR